ncbi:hypothetical protein [Nesterenkonia sandarakina]|uniref:Uncharacterized protein n=1 Tax=Nesterenkonia sandarakina TaxID=272918 RepID=A0A2T0YKB2_9MICC|nr:hypothetical protein [Nesterenkonia sandarakina]PRZ15641.1 hypothetical protein BCL67_108101 [Nesterenkonia sandarakina]
MDHVVGWLFLGFWVVLGVAIVVRLVLALRRRRRGSSLRDSVLRPVLAAGTAGVLPTLDTRTTEHLEHAHGGAGHHVGTSLVEPWPGEPEELSESGETRQPEKSQPGQPRDRPQDRPEDQSPE